MSSASPDIPHIKSEEKETTMLLKVGPFPSLGPLGANNTSGGHKVTVWDEKGRTQIAQIFVSYGRVINSIAFQYIEDDILVTSPLFGCPTLDGSKFVAVMFKDAANEYVTRVCGSYGASGSNEGISSLTIETNMGCYGPFGKLSEKFEHGFEYSFGPERQFNGFHGVSTPNFLRSIGVYVKPIKHLPTDSTSQLTIE